MRANPDRQRHLLHARDGGRRVPPAPIRETLKTRKETMSAIWRSLVLKPKSATLSGQRTTTSMPNIISDRCAQTQKGRKRSCCNGPSRSGPCVIQLEAYGLVRTGGKIVEKRFFMGGPQ